MATDLFTIDIVCENDVVVARQKARLLASALKFEAQDQTRIATAISEVARNTFQYAGGGRAEFRISGGPDDMLMVTFRDMDSGWSDIVSVIDSMTMSAPTPE